MQTQMSNVRGEREREILRKNQKEMLKIRKNVTEMKNASEGLIRVLDWN